MNIQQCQIFHQLSKYFSAPNPHPIPFKEFFHRSPIHILKYMYPYFSSQYNKLKLKEYIEELTKNINQTFQSVMEEDTHERKILLNRLISLSLVIANYNLHEQLVQQIKEQQLVNAAILFIPQLNSDEQIFFINKIILLGHEKKLLNDANISLIMIQKFSSLSKKHKILIFLIKNDKKTAINHIVELYASYFCQIISSILNSLDLCLSDTTKLTKYLSINQKIRDYTINLLLNWWGKANDSLSTKLNSQLKTNILGLLVESMTKQQIIQKKWTIFLTQGIQKRITRVDYGRRAALIIWSRMQKVLQLQQTVTKQFESSELFDFQETKLQSKQEVQQKQKINKKSQSIQQQKESQGEQNEGNDDNQIKIKAPRNIYDCILGLQNKKRRQVTIKYLPSIILKYPDDITLCWLDLTRALLYPLHQDHEKSLIILFTLKPLEVVDVLSERFFKSDASMQQRIIIVNIIKESIQQLSSNPSKYSHQIQNDDKQFYFKKVRSNYFQQSQTKNKESKQTKSRRWGHTRIAHQLKSKPNSLLIINNDPYINRLYEIVNCIFFKIISKLTNSNINLLNNEQFVKSLLLMLCSFVSNIKNHLEKYSIISEVLSLNLKILLSYQSKQTSNIMVLIQVLLKVSLTIDHFINENVILLLKKSVENLKKRSQYGLKPFIQAIQQNIYVNIRKTLGI